MGAGKGISRGIALSHGNMANRVPWWGDGFGRRGGRDWGGAKVIDGVIRKEAEVSVWNERFPDKFSVNDLPDQKIKNFS
jgi:hypothetical protein